LRQPADIANDQAAKALSALRHMLPTSKADPFYILAYRATAKTVAALSGRNPENGRRVFPGYPGMPTALRLASERAGAGAEGARRLEGGVTRLANGLRALSSGASRLATGLKRLDSGTG